MVDIILKTLTAGTNFNLLTLDELKLALGLDPLDSSEDATLTQLITTFSDVVATMCNRVFAQETMRETVRCLQPNRYFVSHYPIKTETDVTSVETPRGSVVSPGAYEIELKSGKIEFIDSGQGEPIVVTYKGGYVLPTEAPPALKEAAIVLIRDERMRAARAATAGIRMMSHKESRVIFFDPMAQMKAGMGGTSAANAAASSLLMHYVRIQC